MHYIFYIKSSSVWINFNFYVGFHTYANIKTAYILNIKSLICMINIQWILNILTNDISNLHNDFKEGLNNELSFVIHLEFYSFIFIYKSNSFVYKKPIKSEKLKSFCGNYDKKKKHPPIHKQI